MIVTTGLESAVNTKKVTVWRKMLVGIPLAIAGWLLSHGIERVSGAVLEIELTARIAGELVQRGSLRYINTAGERFSLTRLSYLLSGFALQRTGGSWFEATNAVAWLDLESGRSVLRLPEIPAGSYSAVRFYVGLDAAENHADISKIPAAHPLNPNVNGLHWSWQGGYIFLAAEGLWRNTQGALDGWSYHLARDTNRVPITLAIPMDLTQDARLEVSFDLGALFNAPHALSFARDGSSTHSRDGDPIAAALVANLAAAFQVRRFAEPGPAKATVEIPKPLFLPVQFIPYPFKLNASFPLPDLPRDNPLTEERVLLGEKLFQEKLLSSDNTISCASCHDLKHAFSDTRRFSFGVAQHTGARNAMALVNLAWKQSYFWDGRAPSLRVQALMPIQDPAEMGESLTNLAAKLSNESQSNYQGLFAAAFGAPEITPEKIGLALENFLLTLTSCDSKFDRALRGETKLSASEQRGFELFATEYDPRRGQFGADCFHCHGGQLFQSQAFANNGLDSEPKDSGRGRVTGRDSDKGKFAVPSLRNVELTAPYMHDGRFQTLEEVVEHYSTGVKRSATLDPNLSKHPDGGVPLSVSDKQALVAFLKTLTETRLGPR